MKRDKAYLKHILDAISDTEDFIRGIEIQEFFENKEKQYAVLRALEIVGEATKNLSKELKARHREVPWKEISGIKDKLIHQYFGVNLQLIWETITNDLPKPEKQITEILNESDK